MTTTEDHAVDREAQVDAKRRVMNVLERHPFSPPAWLANPHAQTIWPRVVRKDIPLVRRQERWDTPDGDFVDLYFLDGEPRKPTALLLHGLEGCSESAYIKGLSEKLGRHGWTAISLEHRSCGKEINRAKRMYHSGATYDLEFVVERLVRDNPQIELFISGISLGGNITAKWLGETGSSVPDHVRAAAVISAPYDLPVSGPHMDTGLTRIYVKHFLKGLIPKAIEKEKQFPGCIDIEAVKRSRTFAEFDTYATAALHGFRDAADYYAKVSCGQFLHGIRRPTLLLSSADDPFNPRTTLPRDTADASPWLHPQFTERGGHAGFVAGSAFGPLHYWGEDQVVRFFLEYACRLT